MKIKLVQDVIDRLRHKILYAESFLKKEVLINSKQSFDTLILGSSHIYQYVTQESELNCALASQDLYSSYKLYEKLNSNSLKNIIISFSVFTPGHCLIKTNDCQMSILYKLIFGIDYEYEDIAKKKKLYSKEKYFLKTINKYRRDLNIPKKYKPVDKRFKEKSYIQKRAYKHLKNNLRPNNEMRWCLKLLEMSALNKQQIYFVIPPFMNCYKEVLPNCEILFKELYSLCEQFDSATILNFYNTDYDDSDFVDGDHLGQEAWNKLTCEIRKEYSKDCNVKG